MKKKVKPKGKKVKEISIEDFYNVNFGGTNTTGKKKKELSDSEEEVIETDDDAEEFCNNMDIEE